MLHHVNWKKFVALLVIVVALIPMLVQAEDTPVTLKVIGFRVAPEEVGTPLDQAYQAFLSGFQEAHPNVTVDSLETPPDFDTQNMLDLAAGTAPDLWSQDASTLARLVDNNYVLDMNECTALVPELTTDRFFPAVLGIHQREGGAIYGLPNDFTPMVMYYNPESFARAGVDLPTSDWTWEQFLDAAQRLTLDKDGHNSLDPAFDENNVTQWGFRVRKFSFEWIYWVWQNGSDVISPDGTTVSGYLDSPETIEAIQFLADMVLKYKVSPTPSALDQMTQQFGFLDYFLKGEFAMFPRGHWELVGLRSNENYQPGRVAVVGNPSNKADATVIYESGWVINAAVKSDPAKLLAACQFIEAATAPGYQDTKNITGIAIAGNKESAEKAAAATEYPDIEQVFINETANGRRPYGAIYAKWPTVETALDSLMENILAGGDVQEEVAAAVEEINRELSQ